MKKAIFAGSFDPFTNGHLDIVKKCAELFDSVYIVIGVNVRKQRYMPAEVVKDAVENTLKRLGLINCRVFIHNGLITDFMRMHGIKYAVRGLRNTKDFEYEEDMARINKILMPEIEYVYLRTENAAISSSAVRELLSFGKDITQFIPQEIKEAQEKL